MPSTLSMLLRRPPGKGWIILAGDNLPDEQVLRTLALIEQAGTALCIVPRAEFVSLGEESLTRWLDLSGWTGKTDNCENTESLEEDIAEASLLLLPDVGRAEDFITALSETDVGEFILAVLNDGAVIVCEGLASEAFGEAAEGESEIPGLGWIPGAVLQSHFSKGTGASILRKRKNLFRIGIPTGTAIALGPQEEREIWGAELPTITFGSGWNV